MKRFLPLLALVVFAAALGYIFLFLKPGASNMQAAEIAPPDAVLYLELPEIPASKVRWQATALHAIFNEPEVVAFLEKPRSQPRSSQVQSVIDIYQQVEPQSAFLSVLNVEAERPSVAAAFRTKKTKEQVDAALKPIVDAARAKYPAGKADLGHHEGVAVESFTAEGFSVAMAFDEGWCVVATSVDLVHAMLDRLQGRGDGGFAAAETGKALFSKAPKVRETLSYFRPGPIIAKLRPMLELSGQGAGVRWQELEAVNWLAAWTVFDGPNIRDGIYIAGGDFAGETGLKQTAMALTSPKTLIYYSALLTGLKGEFKVPDPSMDPTGTLARLQDFLGLLVAEGIPVEKLVASIGAEGGFALDWPDGAFYPSLSLRMDVADRATMGRFCEFLASGRAFGIPLGKKDLGKGTVLYELPSMAAQFQLQPGMALTQDALLIGSDAGRLASIVSGNVSVGDLRGAEGFTAAAKSVGPPDSGFAYIDLRSLFEKVYGIGRTFLMLGAGFMGEAGKQVDLAKLPATETIAKHLGPVVFSKHRDGEGVLMESVGPITTHELVVGIGAGSIFGALKSQGMIR